MYKGCTRDTQGNNTVPPPSQIQATTPGPRAVPGASSRSSARPNLCRQPCPALAGEFWRCHRPIPLSAFGGVGQGRGGQHTGKPSERLAAIALVPLSPALFPRFAGREREQNQVAVSRWSRRARKLRKPFALGELMMVGSTDVSTQCASRGSQRPTISHRVRHGRL
jgi:hypothetical protein